jgi:hypothetical protein
MNYSLALEHRIRITAMFFWQMDRHWQLKVSEVKRENARTKKKLACGPPVLPLTTVTPSWANVQVIFAWIAMLLAALRSSPGAIYLVSKTVR